MNMHAVALPITVADIIDEYDHKIATLPEAIATFERAQNAMQSATCVQGVYAESCFKDASYHESSIKKNLRVSGWKAVYRRLSIERLASAEDKRLFAQTLADPPELTLDNAKATFGDYLIRPRFHALRALAECFTQLDPAYKSHSKVKIGVAGLPKRIVLSSVRGYGSYGRDRLRDIFNALAAVQELPLVDHDEFKPLDALCGSWGNKSGSVTMRGVEIRVFQNGNGHVIFAPDILLTINRALAEFYGEVLPDMSDDGDDIAPRPSTEVSTKLQFYPTPKRVIEKVLDEMGLSKPENRGYRTPLFEPKRVLEPSCGDGRIMDEIRARGQWAIGIEVHAGRAHEARAKGHRVLIGNFLEQPPTPTFDYVVMNPPFHGVHWKKHLAHARKFVAPGGVLACILPATAHYDHGPLEGWHDLPVASFSESGTNVPTGFVIERSR